ncbi:MAG: septum formation protein Maf [Candidatus Sumerlaeia bacterium]|nr:septum formation protein Maf [Candidatus Sumerlaeia bacterium]
MKPIILASASPRRQELLNAMGVPFSCVPSGVDERNILADHPRTFALRAAYAKAMDVASAQPEETWVLAADTVVAFKMRLFGKPESDLDAIRMLRILSGQTHEVITGLALLQAGRNQSWLQPISTRVTFRALSEEEITEYVNSGEPRDKAGAYGIQGLGGGLVDTIDGDYFNVVGLPCEALADLFEEAGLPAPPTIPQPPGRWIQ